MPFKTRFTKWLPEEGHFVWPCWFDGEKAMFQLNKKVLRDNRDIALTYPLKRDKTTPKEVATPSDILKQTLGDELWGHIQARGKRIPHQVKPWPGIGPLIIGACAADVALDRLFKRNLATEQAFLVDLMVNGVVSAAINSDTRMTEGNKLATEKIKKFINTARGDNPAVNSFLEGMEKIIQELEKKRYETQWLPWLHMIGKQDAGWKESWAIKAEHTIEVGEKIKRLARENPENLTEIGALRSQLGYWMFHEPLFRRYLRCLQQEAIIVAAESGEPEVMKAAEEIRRLAREARRNPGWGF